ncbi:MAG: NAD(+) kinase, partial [Duganella sp.]
MTATHADFQTIALVVRPNTDGIAESVGSVVDFLRRGGRTVVFEEHTAGHLELGFDGVRVMGAS